VFDGRLISTKKKSQRTLLGEIKKREKSPHSSHREERPNRKGLCVCNQGEPAFNKAGRRDHQPKGKKSRIVCISKKRKGRQSSGRNLHQIKKEMGEEENKKSTLIDGDQKEPVGLFFQHAMCDVGKNQEKE